MTCALARSTIFYGSTGVSGGQAQVEVEVELDNRLLRTASVELVARIVAAYDRATPQPKPREGK